MTKIFYLLFYVLSYSSCSSQKENVNDNWEGGINWNYPSISQNLKGPIKRIIQYKVINRTGRPEERTYKAFFSWGEHDHGYLLAGIQLRYDRKGLVPGKLNTYSNDTITNNLEHDSLVPKFLKSIERLLSNKSLYENVKTLQSKIKNEQRLQNTIKEIEGIYEQIGK